MNTKSTLSHRGKEPEKGILYLVGTPIGNLSDISPRALNILKNVSLIASEDTRQTKKIMTKNGFSNKLMSFNKINSVKKIQTIFPYLNFNVANPIIARMIDIIQNLITTVDSGQPFFSK